MNIVPTRVGRLRWVTLTSSDGLGFRCPGCHNFCDSMYYITEKSNIDLGRKISLSQHPEAKCNHCSGHDMVDTLGSIAIQVTD